MIFELCDLDRFSSYSLISKRGGKRSLLTIITEELMNISESISYYAFAGTSFQMEAIQSVLPAVGKLDMHIVRHKELSTDTALSTLDEVRDFLKKHVRVESLPAFNDDNLIRKFKGRKRLAANVVEFLIVAKTQNKDASENEIFCIAADMAYNKMVEDLTKQLNRKLEMKNEYTRRLQKAIEEILVFSALSKEEIFITDVDVIDMGISQTGTIIKEEERPISAKIISEAFVIDACQAVIESQGLLMDELIIDYAIEQLKGSVYSCTTSMRSSEKGKAWEGLFLLLFSRLHNNKTLSELPLYRQSESKLPDSLCNIKFSIKVSKSMRPYVGTTEYLFNCSFEEYLSKLHNAFIKSDTDLIKEYTNVLIIPPEKVHPDGLYLTIDKLKLFPIIFSVKLFTRDMTKSEYYKSRCSTMIDRFYLDNYHSQDSSKKPIVSCKHWKWFIENMLGFEGDNKGCFSNGALRVHVHIAPEVHCDNISDPPHITHSAHVIKRENSTLKLFSNAKKIRLPSDEFAVDVDEKDLEVLIDNKRVIQLVRTIIFNKSLFYMEDNNYISNSSESDSKNKEDIKRKKRDNKRDNKRKNIKKKRN